LVRLQTTFSGYTGCSQEAPAGSGCEPILLANAVNPDAYCFYDRQVGQPLTCYGYERVLAHADLVGETVLEVLAICGDSEYPHSLTTSGSNTTLGR